MMATTSNGNRKRIKIRIALAVDCEGNWGVAGGSGMSPREAMELATDGVESGYYRIYWLTAEVEAPQPVEVTIDLPSEAIVEAGQ
jgi:hypothetical protein